MRRHTYTDAKRDDSRSDQDAAGSLAQSVLPSRPDLHPDVWTAIGSSNLDRRRDVFNNEVDAIIVGEDAATQIEAPLQRDFAASAPISLGGWASRPFGERFEELKARLWEYWM